LIFPQCRTDKLENKAKEAYISRVDGCLVCYCLSCYSFLWWF